MLASQEVVDHLSRMINNPGNEDFISHHSLQEWNGTVNPFRIASWTRRIPNVTSIQQRMLLVAPYPTSADRIPAACNQFNVLISLSAIDRPFRSVPGSRWALQRAKFIIEHEYAVVGILERMNQTLAVLERYIPRFFSGAQHTYYDQGYARRHENKDIKNKPELTEPVLEKLKQSLASEYELYEFCQQRLYSQFQQ